MPITYYAQYDNDLNATIVQELSGGAVKRTTTTGYDDLGRVTTSTVATSGTGVATDSITTSYEYSTTTGQPTAATTGNDILMSGYDAWGRADTYADASGNSATTEYDAAGRVSTRNTGATTTSYTYDEHGFLTTAAVDTIGAFAYHYRPDGLIESIEYPNGITAEHFADEVGTQTGLTYTNGSTALLAFTSANDVGGRILRQSSPASAQNFGYDGVGRLTTTQDIRGGSCSTRVYGFSSSSERTSMKSYDAGADGACQSAVESLTKTSNYDTASRITDAGYTYDTLGRTLTVPASDTSAGAGPLVASFRPNDMVESLTQDVTTESGAETHAMSYALDPAGRIASVTTKSDGVETNRIRYRYADSGDSPASVQTSVDGGATWATNRYLTVPELGLVAEADGTSIVYQVANLHRDIVARSSADGSVLSYSESGEYGIPVDSAAGGRYGWLGSDQRSSDALGGLILMGARLYNPNTGLFLSVDPVQGGNATRYGYPEDPVNNADTSGMASYYMRFRIRRTSASLSWFFTNVVRPNFMQTFPFPGRKPLALGARMNLRPRGLYFPVTVTRMYSNGWTFGTRVGHPDFPGTITFQFIRWWFRPNWITMTVNAWVPNYSPGGACMASPACYLLYIREAKSNWTKYANNLRNL
jgi:RHS repeat-associated protein